MKAIEPLNPFIDPSAHAPFLGASFVHRQSEVVLKIGNREWTRTQLVQHIGIGNMSAAGRLSTVLRKARVTSIAQLYTLDPRELALTRGLGETTVFVAMAVLHAEGFDARTWYRGALEATAKVKTFRTMKIVSRKRRK